MDRHFFAHLMKYRFENISVENDRIRISGFIAGDTPESDFSIAVVDGRNHDIPFEMHRLRRNDVSVKYFKKMSVIDHGISISLPYTSAFSILVTIDYRVHRIHLNPLLVTYHNGMQSLRNNAFLQAVKTRLSGHKPVDYQSWQEKHRPSEELLQSQRDAQWPDDSPLFSIVIPLYATPERYLRELIESIEKQTYQKYEVCFADGSPEDQKLEELIGKYQKDNYRIRYQYLNGNFGISGNTNEAVKMASGDFIVLCDHDDLLTENALYELAKAVIENPECDCIYSDEDKIDETSKKYFDPHFKPDYNIDLLTSCNYICHIYAVRKSLVDKTGAFRSEYDGAQDHDFILRTTEQARQIVHIPKVLYHWRTHMASTAANPESKLYAFEAGKKAVRAHFERVWPQYKVEKVTDGASLGIYHTYFDVKEELISVIIPTYNSPDLWGTLESLTVQDYPHIQPVLVDDGSAHFGVQETRQFFQDRNRGNLEQITVLQNPENRGTVCTMNRALSHC
jgi:glycosyltransferase involved in cell wall biosynthesis